MVHNVELPSVASYVTTFCYFTPHRYPDNGFSLRFFYSKSFDILVFVVCYL